MFYVGHFSFDGWQESEIAKGPTNGWFTCIVFAESIGSAIEKFRQLIDELEGEFEGFEPVTNIYLEDCTEVRDLPSQGVIAHFEESYGEILPSVSVSLPEVGKDHCASYVWTESTKAEYLQPFMSFRESPITPLIQKETTNRERLEYGPVRVISGPYEGRIGFYDDEDEDSEGITSAIVYFGDMFISSSYYLMPFEDLAPVDTSSLMARYWNI